METLHAVSGRPRQMIAKRCPWVHYHKSPRGLGEADGGFHPPLVTREERRCLLTLGLLEPPFFACHARGALYAFLLLVPAKCSFLTRVALGFLVVVIAVSHYDGSECRERTIKVFVSKDWDQRWRGRATRTNT